LPPRLLPERAQALARAVAYVGFFSKQLKCILATEKSVFGLPPPFWGGWSHPTVGTGPLLIAGSSMTILSSRKMRLSIFPARSLVRLMS